EYKGTVSHESTPGVIRDHKDYYQYKPADDRNKTLFQCLFAERRTYNAFLNDGERCRQRSGAEYVCQVFRFFHSEVPSDLRVAVRDFALHIRSRIHYIVQNN